MSCLSLLSSYAVTSSNGFRQALPTTPDPYTLVRGMCDRCPRRVGPTIVHFADAAPTLAFWGAYAAGARERDGRLPGIGPSRKRRAFNSHAKRFSTIPARYGAWWMRCARFLRRIRRCTLKSGARNGSRFEVTVGRKLITRLSEIPQSGAFSEA